MSAKKQLKTESDTVQYSDWITIVGELLNPEDGSGMGMPDQGSSLGVVGPDADGVVQEASGFHTYLVRMRLPLGDTPTGPYAASEAEFQALYPDLWQQYMPNGGALPVFL